MYIKQFSLIFLLSVIGGSFFSSCDLKKQNSSVSSSTLNNGETVDYCVNNAFGNPITGNCAEYYNGVTYIAYQGEKEDPYVVAYNHKESKWIGPYKAGVSLLGKNSNKKIDNHGKPTLVVDGEGYIHVAFGGHGGTLDLGENTLGNYNGGKQIHVRSKRPMDISSWEEVDNISPFGTYSQFIKMDNGDIYLFYRHGAHRSNWVYQVSKDNCRTFSPLVSFLKAKPFADDGEKLNIWDSWYVALEKGKNDDIHVLYNFHKCRSENGVHVGERYNAYFMTLDTKTNTWRNINGKVLKLPLTKEDSDILTLAVETPGKWTHLGNLSFDKDLFPRIYWYEGEDNGTQYGGPKRLTDYYWNGSEWIGGSTNLPVEARGEQNLQSPDSVRYLLASTKDSHSEIAWWVSDKQGKDFRKSKAVINGKEKFMLSHFVVNGTEDAYIVATQKIAGTDYSKLYLIGNSGVIKREKSKADIIPLK